ncbi:MAG: hypothetical protein ACPGC4_01190 [Litorivicinaceae bacterium]
MSYSDARPFMGTFGRTGLNSLGIAAGANTYGTNDLPRVDDPDQAYADMTRGEYDDYVRNYRDFELDLIEQAQTDTSLIDQAREDAASASELTRGIAERNASRYGANLTPMQIREQQRSIQRSNTLGAVQSVNDARIAQREANTRLLADLINIGQGVNRSSQAQLGTSAANAAARQQAYDQARAQSRAQTYSTIGSLGAAAILAFAI